jgi:hypothetical protein
VAGADRPERRQAIEKGPSGKACLGAERERAHHVEAAANSAVDHDGRARTDRRDDRGQHIDRGGRAVEMAAAMIGHDDAVGAQRDGALGVGGMQDAFDHEGALPALAQARQLLPGVAAAAAQLHGARGRDLGRIGARIGHQILGPRHAVLD